MDTSVSDDNGNAAGSVFFTAATLITDVLFEQFLICAAI